MKKIRFIAFLFMAVLGVGSAFAGAQDFILVNATEHTVHSVYISSSGSSVWGPDRLTGYLEPGDWTTFTFTGYDDDLCLKAARILRPRTLSISIASRRLITGWMVFISSRSMRGLR